MCIVTPVTVQTLVALMCTHTTAFLSFIIIILIIHNVTTEVEGQWEVKAHILSEFELNKPE